MTFTERLERLKQELRSASAFEDPPYGIINCCRLHDGELLQFCSTCVQEREAGLAAQVERLKWFITLHQWNAKAAKSGPECFLCGGIVEVGHAFNCEVQALLSESPADALKEHDAAVRKDERAKVLEEVITYASSEARQHGCLANRGNTHLEAVHGPAEGGILILIEELRRMKEGK